MIDICVSRGFTVLSTEIGIRFRSAIGSFLLVKSFAVSTRYLAVGKYKWSSRINYEKQTRYEFCGGCGIKTLLTPSPTQKKKTKKGGLQHPLWGDIIFSSFQNPTGV